MTPDGHTVGDWAPRLFRRGIPLAWPALLGLMLSLLVGCDSAQHEAASSGRPTREFGSNVVAYPAKGLLEEVRAGGWKAVIAHEDIPGYMEAMTMLLDVRDTNELKGLQPGDKLSFRVLVTDTDGWIDHVTKLGSGPAPTRTNSLAAGLTGVDELVPGDPVPDCALTNQLGQAVHLSDFKGRALAFTFIFTRCPFPVYCPRMSQNFAAVQAALSRQAVTNVGATNWHLVSISFDPEYDTPARLAEYAATYRHDPAHWTFATGNTEEVRRLGSAFQLAFWKEGGIFSHNVRTVVVDTRGRIRRIFSDNEWKAGDLVDEMNKAMRAE